MSKSPAAQVKEKFDNKDQLVQAVRSLATDDLWLDRVNPVKGLDKVSNAKLLRLHALLTQLKQQFGTRAKLIDAIVALEKRDKDAGFRTRLERYPAPRLLDLHRAAERRAGRAEAKAKAAAPKAKKKVVRSRKARAKAGAA
jgi:hypothetical protein